MAVTAATETILERALDRVALGRDEALHLVRLDLDSEDCYALMAAANRFSRRKSGGRGTVYSQVGLNVWPFPENCTFCYLGATRRPSSASRTRAALARPQPSGSSGWVPQRGYVDGARRTECHALETPRTCGLCRSIVVLDAVTPACR
jgi:hypothetical protein